MESDAKEIAILDLIEAWLPRQTRFSSTSDRDAYDAEIDALVQSYQRSLGDVSAEAVQRSVRQFITGKVDRNNAFRPQPPEVAANARMWDEAIAYVTADRALADASRQIVSYPIGGQPEPGFKPLGPTSVNFGNGNIDMSEMSFDEKEAVMKNRGLPKPDGQPSIVPQLKRM